MAAPGNGADTFNSYAQRGILPIMQDNAAAVAELIPSFSRLRVMRQWAGICDISPDSSPIVGKSPIAKDQPHELLQAFTLDRFETGRLVDEGAAAGVAH